VLSNSHTSPNTYNRDGTVQEAYSSWDETLILKYGFDLMAAAQLAVGHFNSRDASVVPALASLEDCNVKISEHLVADSRLDSDTSVLATLQTIANRNADTFESSIPCAILGLGNMAAAEAVADVTSALSNSQVLYDTFKKENLESRSTIGMSWSID
jgi:hypothetical protein